jgi:hypothetical protein
MAPYSLLKQSDAETIIATFKLSDVPFRITHCLVSRWVHLKCFEEHFVNIKVDVIVHSEVQYTNSNEESNNPLHDGNNYMLRCLLILTNSIATHDTPTVEN